MTKRILALLLAVLLGISCFALTACGGEEEKKEETKKEETQKEPTVATPVDPTTPGTTDEVAPTLQLFTTEATLIIGEETWEFATNSFVLNHKTLTFTSSDEAVATVDADGVVTPVAAGTATIKIVAANGDLTAEAELALTVKAPFEPTTAEDKAIFGIMRDSSITKLESYGTWSVNITAENVAKYNEEGLEGTTAGPVEIWSDTLQFLFTLKLSEIDVTAGAGEEGYNVFFDLYFKPYDAATEKDGGYSVATIQAWSVYKDTASDFAIYRCDFGDTKLMDLEEGKYTVQIVVREGELVKGWCTATNFVWTDSCVAFVNYAKNHPDEVTITK